MDTHVMGQRHDARLLSPPERGRGEGEGGRSARVRAGRRRTGAVRSRRENNS